MHPRPPYPSRRPLAAGLALAAGLGLTAALAVPAQAAVPPVLQKTSKVVTADALPTAQIDGIVWTQAVAGNTVFAGGRFASARPAGAAAGTKTVKRANLMSYDIRTGRMTSFAPTLNGQVRALALSPDKKVLYVGGDFTTANGKARAGLAAFTVSTGKLRGTVLPINGRVNAITTLGTTVYFGGWFTRVGPKGKATSQRLRVAAFNATTGKPTAWNPRADGSVEALVATPDGKRIVIGGHFTTLGGKPNPGMGAVTTGTGAVRTWKVNTKIKNSGSRAWISALVADQDTVYGAATGYESGNYEGVFAANPGDGSIKWLQDCHGDQYGLAPVGNLVYSVGHAHFCTNIGGFGEISPQRALVATKAVRGTVATNTQTGHNYANWAGYPAPALYQWFPKLNIGTVSGSNQGAWSVAATSRYVVLGGEFTTVNGKPQQGLVRFTTPGNGAPRKAGPQDKTVTSFKAWNRPDGAGLGWEANYDPDDRTLTYTLTRDGKVVRTFRSVSAFYHRPWLQWVDTTAVPGKRHTYRVSVTDPDGNTAASPKITFTRG